MVIVMIIVTIIIMVGGNIIDYNGNAGDDCDHENNNNHCDDNDNPDHVDGNNCKDDCCHAGGTAKRGKSRKKKA